MEFAIPTQCTFDASTRRGLLSAPESRGARLLLVVVASFTGWQTPSPPALSAMLDTLKQCTRQLVSTTVYHVVPYPTRPHTRNGRAPHPLRKAASATYSPWSIRRRGVYASVLLGNLINRTGVYFVCSHVKDITVLNRAAARGTEERAGTRMRRGKLFYLRDSPDKITVMSAAMRKWSAAYLPYGGRDRRVCVRMCDRSLQGWGARGAQPGEAKYGMRVCRWSPSRLQNGSGGRLQHSQQYVCSFSGGSCSFADV